jgi:hypothetical protein
LDGGDGRRIKVILALPKSSGNIVSGDVGAVEEQRLRNLVT